MWPLLIGLGLVVGLVAITSKAGGGSKMGKFTPIMDDQTLANATALMLVSLPGSKDDEVSLSNAVFKAGLNIASLSTSQAAVLGKKPGMNIVQFGGKPVGIIHVNITGDITMPLLIQARMANPNVPSLWFVLAPNVPSTFSIPGYSVIGTIPVGGL